MRGKNGKMGNWLTDYQRMDPTIEGARLRVATLLNTRMYILRVATLGGCQGNANRFVTREFCEAKCLGTSSSEKGIDEQGTLPQVNPLITTLITSAMT